MSNCNFTAVCDVDGGTYVSQFEGNDPEQIARQWASMLKSERPIPGSSTQIANSLIHELDDDLLLTPLTGLKTVWQTGAQVGRAFYTATFGLSA